MIFRQYLHSEPVIGASYLLGCVGKGLGAVVDPIDDPDMYLRESETLGLPLRYVIDTHVHADHISGGRRLAAATGAEYVLFESADATYAFRSVADGEVLELGNVSLEVLHTPGHTPEHMSLLGTDRARGVVPWFLLTGHTLMVGDMGRTELDSSAVEGAHALFESAERLRRLDDHIEIFPGAYSGSVCGRALSGKPYSTIGFERRMNRAFAETDREAFTELMLRDIPPRPTGADAIRASNLGRGTRVDGGVPAGWP